MLQDFIEQIGPSTVGGLVIGSIYALVALGYTLVYGILELINFAHGDVFMALEVANRGYVLETGFVVLEGSAADLKTNEQVRKTYLGED